MIFIPFGEVHCSSVVACRPKRAAPPRRNYETAPFKKKLHFFKILFHARFKNGLGFKQNKVVRPRSSFKDSKKSYKIKDKAERSTFCYVRSQLLLLLVTDLVRLLVRSSLSRSFTADFGSIFGHYCVRLDFVSMLLMNPKTVNGNLLFMLLLMQLCVFHWFWWFAVLTGFGEFKWCSSCSSFLWFFLCLILWKKKSFVDQGFVMGTVRLQWFWLVQWLQSMLLLIVLLFRVMTENWIGRKYPQEGQQGPYDSNGLKKKD